MWKTTEADGFPDAGAECFVWAAGWAKARIAEAFASGDVRGFSNYGGDVEGVTHWQPLVYPSPPEAAAPVAKAATKRTRAT